MTLPAPRRVRQAGEVRGAVGAAPAGGEPVGVRGDGTIHANLNGPTQRCKLRVDGRPASYDIVCTMMESAAVVMDGGNLKSAISVVFFRAVEGRGDARKYAARASPSSAFARSTNVARFSSPMYAPATAATATAEVDGAASASGSAPGGTSNETPRVGIPGDASSERLPRVASASGVVRSSLVVGAAERCVQRRRSRRAVHRRGRGRRPTRTSRRRLNRHPSLRSGRGGWQTAPSRTRRQRRGVSPPRCPRRTRTRRRRRSRVDPSDALPNASLAPSYCPPPLSPASQPAREERT